MIRLEGRRRDHPLGDAGRQPGAAGQIGDRLPDAAEIVTPGGAVAAQCRFSGSGAGGCDMDAKFMLNRPPSIWT